MIGTADMLQMRTMVRREIEAHARGPQFNSHQTPRGTTQNRINRPIGTSFPKAPRELDEFTLAQSDGSLVPFVRMDNQWVPLGGSYVVYDGLYLQKGDFHKVTIALASAGPLPLDSEFTKEFDETVLEVFMAGGGFRATAGEIGMNLVIAGSTVADITTFTNETLSHKAFVPRTLTFPSATLGTGSYAAGTYDLDVTALDGNTQSDGNDTFYVTITEKFAETT